MAETMQDRQAAHEETEAERRKKEAYFTASQGQLIWARFRKNRSAMIAGTVPGVFAGTVLRLRYLPDPAAFRVFAGCVLGALGGGMPCGQVIGATDRLGGEPADRPVHFQEIFATLYRNLGIDANATTVSDLNGRPRYLVDDNRQPIPELA